MTETITQQEIFDQVAIGLHKQGKMSITNGICKYRDENGAKCAVGLLITDEEYNPSMDIDDDDGTGLYMLMKKNLLPERLKSHLALLNNLQVIHDASSRSEFWPSIKAEMIELAPKYELSTAVMDNLL